MILTADPKTNYLTHAEEIREAIDRVLASGLYILGPEVGFFEKEFSYYIGPGATVGVANGTDAIELSLRAAGVSHGDLVATVANTVSATSAAIEQAGATPVFVDVDRASMTMDVQALAAALASSPKPIKAVVPVHLYGHPADMGPILELSHKQGALVIEDCAQAHGAAIGKMKTGMLGDLAAFSFYPTKNLGAIGDAGAVFYRDDDLGKQVRLLRQYGWKKRYISDVAGRNSRLDELQAAILRVKLRYLDEENSTRRRIASRYLTVLADCGIELPSEAAGTSHAWHQFTVRTPRREALRTHLAEQGIMAGVLYPVPLHRQPAYAQVGVDLPVTERCCAEVLCLPCHPGLTDEDVDRVTEAVLRWANA